MLLQLKAINDKGQITRNHSKSCCGIRPEQAQLRVDHGLAEGDEVSPWYDAMVAKFVAHGRDRGDAIRRLRAALKASPLLGLANKGQALRQPPANARLVRG